jgi:O-antigen/teichoic acid export membrane protein
LRNKFAEARAKEDMTLAKGYVSSAYFTIGAFSLGFILVFTVCNFFIDWTEFFNTSPSLQKELNLLLPIVFVFFCLQLVFKLITTIYAADQNHSMPGKINFYTQFGSLLLIWMLTKTNESSLLLFGIIYSLLPVVILIFLNLFAFGNRYKEFKPSYAFCKNEYIKGIFGLGSVFFIIQISGIILFSTDNLIISKLFSPAEVVPYNVAYKYISIGSMLFSIIAAPYWTSITDAYSRGEMKWIKKAMRNFHRISLFFVLVLFLMVLVSQPIYSFWIGSKVEIHYSLTLLMSIFFGISIFVTPYTMFLNGTGKIKLQAIQGILVSLINIPLSIFLSHTLKFGINGVILSTIICLIPGLILGPIQYHKILTKTAKGIWNS